MKRMRNVIFLVLLVVGVLFYTNPDQQDFAVFLSEYVQDELAEGTPGESELGRTFRKGLGQIAGSAASRLAQREDHIVASVYTLDIAGSTHRFLGIAGQFIPLKETKLQVD